MGSSNYEASMGAIPAEAGKEELREVPKAFLILEKHISVLSNLLTRLEERTASAQSPPRPTPAERPEARDPGKPVQLCALAREILDAAGVIAEQNAHLEATIDRLEL